ncbi:MAG: DUF5069 domain-containing protein [Candidatus Synoicihabitans palmerolidicus]|nr:DUF5069 domain-containing protein [Candidatus Synoicihabitans palmerolidicus]
MGLPATQLTPRLHPLWLPAIPGLRSPYSPIGRLLYVGRMFDKIRLHHQCALPSDYHPSLGIGLDGRASAFLGVDYPAIVNRVLEGGTDEEILSWAFQTGVARSEHDCMIWSRFMQKLG